MPFQVIIWDECRSWGISDVVSSWLSTRPSPLYSHVSVNLWGTVDEYLTSQQPGGRVKKPFAGIACKKYLSV
jgi:hypothetical protein